MLIYLQPPAQQKVLSLFHFALNRGGVLFLGPSESLGPLADDFEILDKHWQLYRKHSDVRMPVDPRRPPVLTLDSRVAIPSGPARRQAFARPAARPSTTRCSTRRMPPSLLVNDRGELVHAFGGASRFLRSATGARVSTSSTGRRRAEDDARRRPEARARRTHARRLQRRSRRRGRSGVQRHHPSGSPGAGRYARTCWSRSSRLNAADRPAARAPTEIDLDQVSREQLAALEAELGNTKENLQAAIEELETSNEELQASNEELQASNEELQSTNEELQSVNEELYTVNAEYQRKIARADRADQRHGQPAGEHRGRHDLPRRTASDPQVHAADRRDLQPAAARRRPAHRDVRAQDGPPGAHRRSQARAHDRAAGRARAASICTASRSSCASCPTAPRVRSTAWS